MAITDEQYRKGMRQLAAAVSVITAEHGSVRNGLTATAVMSLCAQPPRLAVAVNRSASALPTLQAAGCFAVNVLRFDQDTIAGQFASSTVRGADRFEGAQWTTLATGAPVLEGAAASFDCRISQTLEIGTHLLIIGEVEDLQVNPSERPLLYLDGTWASLIKANREEISQYDTTVARCIESVDKAHAQEGDAAAKLEGFVRDFTAVNIQQTGITRGFLKYEPYLAPDKLAQINRAKNEFDSKLRALIEEGVRTGEFELDDPGLAALAITGMVGWIHRWYRLEGRYTPEQMGEHLTRMALNMVRAQMAEASHP